MVAQVAVIGGGVIGLSTALNIQSHIPGAKVKVIAEKFYEGTTSHGSGGIWFPTLKALANDDERRVRKWVRGSWDFYRLLATGPEAGKCGAIISNGYIVTRNEYPNPLYKDYVFSYRKLRDEERKQFGFPAEYKHVYNATTIILDQRKYLKWLMDRFIQKGGEIEERKVLSLKEFAGKYGAVVNCTGFGSRELVGDDRVFAIRGQVVKVRAPWIKNWVCDPEDLLSFPSFIIPGENLVTLGSTKQMRQENLEPSASDTDDLIQRCARMVPSVKSAEIDHVWVGLRPGRDKVRVEAEELRYDNHKLKVVHNYGHGSNGVALAWGTSIEAADLVKKSLHIAKPRL